MATTLSGFTITKPTALTATAASTSGDLDAEAEYGYVVTYVTGFGETDGSTADTVTTTTAGSVTLSAIPVSSDGNVTGRKIYRTIGGGATYLLLTTISDNTTTTYTDTTADADLGAEVPTLNSAHSLQNVLGLFKISKPSIHSLETGITAGVGGSSAAAIQLSSEYNWITTVASANDSVKLPEAAASLIGSRIKIRNDAGVNAARIYPFDGQTVNGGAADAPTTLAAGAAAEFVMRTATNWQII